MTWAHSPGYGGPVVLGPTQEAVYRFVLGATEGGRRPEYTLAHIGSVIGKPVSSVHDALGRLRALGLIGCAARMGRTGGHRLWRVSSRVMGALDVARHRRAIARVIKRWYGSPVVARVTEDHEQAAPSVPLWSERPGDSGSLPPVGPVPQGVPSGESGSVPGPGSPGRSFRELIGLHHRLPWEDVAPDGHP